MLVTSIGRGKWPRLRQAVQTAVAACLAYAAADVLKMPQGFWAVVTAIMVMQANVGGSLGMAIDRLLGSLLGVLVGGAAAIVLADVHALKYVGLAATVLVLGYFSAPRAPLRIACVTAAIVILGDPRLGVPISSAGYRMIEVLIGTAIAILTSLLVFPLRAGPALADHVRRTLPLYFKLLSDILRSAAEGSYEESALRGTIAQIRAALATSAALAGDAKVETAGHLAAEADPDAILRALRRLWHTEIMLMRATSPPLPVPAIEALHPQLERLRLAVEGLLPEFADVGRPGRAAPSVTQVNLAIAAFEQAMLEMRRTGKLRAMGMDEVTRLMAFDFALGQLRLNLEDLADRSRDLAGFSGSALPFVRKLQGRAGI
jgi:uncharacterized membrane protein YccC